MADPGKFIVVIYREVNASDGFITAYYSGKFRNFQKRNTMEETIIKETSSLLSYFLNYADYSEMTEDKVIIRLRIMRSSVYLF